MIVWRTIGGQEEVKTILSIAEEEFLVKVIKLYQEWQQPVSKPDILELTKTYMKQLGKKTKNQDGNELKLNDWYYGFLARWSTELKTMKTSPLEKIRSQSLTPDVIKHWFNRSKLIMAKLNLFDRPQSIYNVDESGFSDHAGRKTVIVKRSTKIAISTHGGSGKSFTTVLLCTSASG
ncbi:unnamed protein product, partial [Didymodactylos carnosus]